MNKKLAIPALAALSLTAAALAYFNSRSEPTAAYIDPSNQMLVERGKVVYEQHCASCHGADLEGQPEWRQRLPSGRLPAPPHNETGHTWHHPDAVLFDIVKNGLVPGRTAPTGYESDMPAYADKLPDDDIVAVLAYIKSQWPSEALELQKDMTLQQAQK